MKYEAIRKKYTLRQLEALTGVRFEYISMQENIKGFSSSSIKKFLKAFPKLDTKDMLENYPIKKQTTPA